MTDTLQALLAGDPVATAPVNDLSFTLAVMAKVERRRLQENLVTLGIGCVAVGVLLAIIMPFVTPYIVAVGQAVMPIAIVLVALAMMFFGFQQMRPGMRAVGLPF